jgi:hypothetical protein
MKLTRRTALALGAAPFAPAAKVADAMKINLDTTKNSKFGRESSRELLDLLRDLGGALALKINFATCR